MINVPLWCGTLVMRAAVRVGGGAVWEVSGPSAQYCWDPDFALKTCLKKKKVSGITLSIKLAFSFNIVSGRWFHVRRVTTWTPPPPSCKAFHALGLPRMVV